MFYENYVVITMKTINQNQTPDINPDNNFDALCQGFDGEHFYGLEYILEDFFQRTTVKPAEPVQQSVDWFGLNT
jgi:hypothetical protein